MAFPLREWFDAIDTSRDGSLDGKELQKALALGNLHFSLQTVAHMIRLHDSDQSGTISFGEFEALHNFLTSMGRSFQYFDVNNDQQLSQREVKDALQYAGFRLDEPAFYSLFMAYDPDRSNSLGLAEYIAMTLFLKSASSMFTAFDHERTGRITLDYNQFIYATTNCR